MNLNAAIALIKQQLDLVTVMELAGVEFTYKGTESCKAKCFLHDEKHPSLTVSIDKQLYHCFSTGCAASGDVISFYQQRYGYTLIEAVNALISDFGLDITLEHDAEYDLRNKYYKVHLRLCDKLLKSEAGLRYMGQRGITADTIKKYMIGFSPSVRYTAGVAKECGLSFDEIEQLELNRPQLYENTILFPCIETNGNGMSVYAHCLTPNQNIKYVGCSNKHRLKWQGTLFGLQVANKCPKNDGIIIVEGFFDVLQCYENGIYNVVAICGSNPIEAQLKHIINTKTNCITIMLDGDNAGINGTELCLKLNTDNKFKIALLPNEYDPDDFIKAKGVTELKKILDKAVSPIDFLVTKFVDKIYNTNDTNVIIDIYRQTFKDLMDYNGINKIVALQKISEVSGISTDILCEGLSANNNINDSIDIEAKILNYYLHNIEQFSYSSYNFKSSDFIGYNHSAIYNFIKHMNINGVQKIDDAILAEFDNKEAIDTLHIIYNRKCIDNIDYYLKKLQNLVVKRGIYRACRHTIAALSEQSMKSQDILDKHLIEISGIASPDVKTEFTTGEQVRSAMSYVYDMMQTDKKFPGIDLGPKWHNLMLSFMGFQAPRIYLIAATAKVGKTSLAQNFNLNMNLQGISTLWFNLEMSERDMMLRNMSMLTGISNRRLQAGAIGDVERERLEKAAIKLYNTSSFVVNASGYTIEQIINVARKYVYTKGVKAIFIDYLQLIAPSKSEYWESNAHISTQLKSMATQLNVPIIAISQLGREAEKSNSSSGMYIQGAYKFIQDCDVYMGFSVNKEAVGTGALNNRIINIEYNRHGICDTKIDVFFDGETLRCEEIK